MTTPAIRLGRPVFLFASGWRTGSTLLQRLLCSHPDIHIWGENRGLCDVLDQLYRELLRHQPAASRADLDYRLKGTDGWIANLAPAPEAFVRGVGALLDQYLAAPAREAGKSRWGFKEVRHQRQVGDFLRLIYPDAQVVLIVRHPRACLASARATQSTWRLLDQVGGPTAFLMHWGRTARSFLGARQDGSELLVRFEDFTAQPQDWIPRLGAFLGVSPDGFRGEVLSTRRRGWTDDEPRLTDDDEAALDGAGIWEVAREYGYEA